MGKPSLSWFPFILICALCFHHSQSKKRFYKELTSNIKVPTPSVSHTTIMHTTCFNPNASFNHPSYFFHDTFERNPLLISSSSSSQKCCCSCCFCYYATNVSIWNRLSPINHSFLYKGLRQSTLIQWSFCKRLIFQGRIRKSYAGSTSGASSFIDLDGNCYNEKISSLKETRKKGFRHKRKKQFLSNVSDDYVDVMLNLLTDGVGLEYIDFRDPKKSNKKHICCDDKEKKNAGFGVVKKDEAVKVGATEREDQRKRNDRGEILTKNVNLNLRKGDFGGELEGKKDIEVKSDGHVGIPSSNVYKNDLEKRDRAVCIDEDVGNVNRRQECAKEQAKILGKKDTMKGYYGELVGVSQDWRKKSEKRLNEEFSQHQLNVSVNIDKACRQQHSPKVDKIADESGSRLKYKRFEELSDKDNSLIESTNSSQKQYNNTEKKLDMISEISKPQEIDTRGTSSSSSSKSRIKKWEENATEVSIPVKEKREEKHQKKDNLIRLTTDSSEKSRVLGISDTHVTNSENTSVYDNGEQDKLKASDDGSGSFRLKDGGSRHSSQGSGPKGPSDEMWHVTDASTQEPSEPSETDAPDHISDLSENSGAVKSNGRSLWMVIGDVVRFRWASLRSGSHTPNSGGGKGSSYVSASSEAWFSSHEPDDSNDGNMKKRSMKGLDSPLPSSNNNEGPCGSTSLPKVEETSFPSPAMRMRRSTGIEKTSEAGETNKPVPELLTEVSQTGASGSDAKNRELKRRKLIYKDQVSNDNFDEWEVAYTIEAKQQKNDELFMREALLEARKAADVWEVPVGAVLVRDGKIIARGYNLVEELHDSTAHAEMICIRNASTNLRSWRLSDTTLYVTLEPCPMCAGAILQARINTVVWGAPNKLLGADGSWIRVFCEGNGGSGSMLTDKPPAPPHPFHPNMVVRREVLAAECADVMQQFFRLRRKKITESEPEPELQTPPSSVTISHHHRRHHSNFFSKIRHAFNIIFCL